MEIWTRALVLTNGGSLGVNARYWLGVWMSRWASPQFPWATFVINVSGSFLIGFLTVALTRWMPHPQFRLMVITGFLGGYTTFSTFENDALVLWESGECVLMAVNLIGSVVLGLLAVVLGTALARGLAEPAIERSTAGPRSVETRAAGLRHPVDEGPRSPSRNAGRGTDGHRGIDGGGQP
jgi:CrcB protein